MVDIKSYCCILLTKIAKALWIINDSWRLFLFSQVLRRGGRRVGESLVYQHSMKIYLDINLTEKLHSG